MDDKIRCQSCGMPLGPGFFGTDANGAEISEYCMYCYKNGVFTNPDLTLEEMIDVSVKHMKNELNMPEEEARENARSVIPNLKRWQK